MKNAVQELIYKNVAVVVEARSEHVFTGPEQLASTYAV